MGWINLAIKAVQGAGKLIGKIATNKRRKKEKRAAKLQAQAAQLAAFGGSGTSVPRVSDLKNVDAIQDAVFGKDKDSDAPTPSGGSAWDKVVEFAKENWKFVVPSAVGLLFVLGSLVVKMFKRKR